MNDRFLFRAKRIDNGEWVEGCLLVLDDETYRIATSCLQGNAEHLLEVCAYEVDPSTICQCTGLKDKNGNLIWDNDIVRFQFYNDDCQFPYKNVKKRIGKVFFSDFRASWSIAMRINGSKCFNNDLFRYVRNGNRVEIIGNIFDNPELMHE